MTEDNQPSGSELCLECGLCCRGAFHRRARLAKGEKPRAKRLGLRVLEPAGPRGKEPGFALPCPRLVDRKCEVYEERPSPCRDFRCSLLDNFLNGSVELEAALGIVHKLQDLAAEIARRVGVAEASLDGSGTFDVWGYLEANPDVLETRPELQIDIAGFRLLGQLHFVRSQGQELRP